MNRPPAPPPKIGIGHGWHWFTGALGMVRHWPTVFLPMGFIVAAIHTLIPILGPLAILIMGPAFLAGIGVAAHTAASGRPPAIRQLFAMFEHPAQRHEALKLCIPLVIGKVAAFMVLGFALADYMSSQGIRTTSLEGHPEKVMALLESSAMRPWLFVALALLLLAWTFTALAIPRVALSRARATAAMAESFRLVWRHLAAWIVALVALLAGLIVLAWLLLLTRIGLLMQLGVLTAMYAVLGPMLYIAWRDLGGTPSKRETHPPSAPPSPPPPTGVLEA